MLENIILQERLQPILEILKSGKSKRMAIIQKHLEDVLGSQIPTQIHEKLNGISKNGFLIDYIVAYNMAYDMGIHLTYQRQRIQFGEEKINHAIGNKKGRGLFTRLSKDVKNDGYFLEFLTHNLERRQRLVKHIQAGIPTWGEWAVLQNQLGVEPQYLINASKKLEKKLDYYVLNHQKFKEDVLVAFAELKKGETLHEKDLINFLIKLSVGEDVIYQHIKEKAHALLDKYNENFLFQRSERGFEYLFKLFYNQEHKAIIKIGIDPTDPDLHLGHTVPLNVLREFQDIGYHVTVILGDRTARIGDPTGVKKERPRLSAKQIAENVKKYKGQVLKVLDENKTNLVYNSTWLDNLDPQSRDEIRSKFNIRDIQSRKDFKRRSNEGRPPSLLEEDYAVFQAIDSLVLGSVVEMGGKDQLINMIFGRRLQEAYNVEQQLVLFTQLLPGIRGKEKMSKSLNNYIAINDSPEAMYKKIMALPDYGVYTYYVLLTNIEECFRDVPKKERRDLFSAFGGLNLLTEHAAKIVKDNEIILKGDNKKILERLQQGNGDLKYDKKCKSKDCELLEEFIDTLEREIHSNGRKIKENFKPHYQININFKRKNLIKIKGLDDLTKEIVKTLFSYQKESSTNHIYHPNNLKERLEKYIVEIYHGEDGLKSIESLIPQIHEKKKETIRYVDLNNYSSNGEIIKVGALLRREFDLGVDTAVAKAKNHLFKINNKYVRVITETNIRNGSTHETVDLNFKPGEVYRVEIGSKRNRQEKVFILGFGPNLK